MTFALPTLLMLALAGAATSLLTGLVRRYALNRRLMDIPNDRSSHVVPTPRGGGLAIAMVVLGTLLFATLRGVVTANVGVALVGGGLLIALVGWIDDRRGLTAGVRATAHTVAAVWALTWLGGMPRLTVGESTLSLGLAGSAFAVVGVVWMTNLYNFMDGIDGIAGGEAVSVGLAGGLLLWVAGQPELAFCAFLLAAASAGFLFWNWAPAKIFMGDVGSALLGYLFAVLAIASELSGSIPLAAWFLLLGVFWMDATLTLVRRVVNGERWYSAHRSHAYQRMVQAGWSHSRVSGCVLVLNIALAVVSLVVVRYPTHAVPALLTGVLMLSTVYLLVERLRPMYSSPSAPPPVEPSSSRPSRVNL